MSKETTSDTDSESPKPKRATVASVDAKVDEILEEVEGLRIEMSQIKSALRELAKILSGDDDGPKLGEERQYDNSMFG